MKNLSSMPDLSSPLERYEASRTVLEGNFRKLLQRSTVALALALGVPLLVLLALVVFLLHSVKMVNHSNEVILKATEVKNLLITMQNGARGYRLGHDATYLEPYDLAKPKVLPQIDHLAQLVEDNPPQKDTVGHLRGTAVAWMNLVQDYLKIMKEAGQYPSETTLRQGRGLMDDTQSRLDGFVAEEQRLKDERADYLGAVIIVVFTLFGVATLLGIPALISFLQTLLRRATGAYQESLASTTKRARELHVTLSSIGDGVVATDVLGRVEFLNPVAEKLMGWTTSEAYGKPLKEVFAIFNEQTGAATDDPVERVLLENVVVELANHTILRSRQGVEVPIEDSAAPIHGEDGAVLGVILVFHDVTTKKKAEKRTQFLTKLGEETRNLTNGESIMAVATRLLGETVGASRCAYAEVNPETDQFEILQDYTDGCASTAGSYFLAQFGPRAVEEMHAGRTLVVRNIEVEATSSEGAAIFDQIGIKAVICCPLVKEGRLRAMMAVHQVEARDWKEDEIALVEEVVERCWATVERARAEEESKERAERFRLLTEVVSLQVWMADLQGKLSFVSQECVDYFGVGTAEAILGTGWTEFVHPEDFPGVAQCWQEALASQHRYIVEFRLRKADGSFRWFLARAEVMRNEEGDAMEWFGTNTDIHDLKVAQAKAEEANRAKDTFLAALSHELRTPLTPVLMSAVALRDDKRLPGEFHEQLEMMERNIALEARLIDDLLDVTSIAQGKLKLHKQSCDAHALIRLALEIVQQDVTAKQILIHCEFLAGQSELNADPARFQQVIWNLLRNAVKFTPVGGEILIRTMDHGAESLRIEISDSGIGIRADLLEKIFSPFEQGDLTGISRFGGLGMGLAIARAILEVHGGAIHAQSLGVGQGATFVVVIPSSLPLTVGYAHPGQTTSAGQTECLPKSSLRLLVVEDHASTLQVLTRLLMRDGHQVVAANSATSALEAAAQNSFDLVISDVGLPDSTGQELMKRLREQYGLRGIALSGYGMEEDLERSRDVGFILHLVKPVDFTRLRQALHNVMEGVF